MSEWTRRLNAASKNALQMISEHPEIIPTAVLELEKSNERLYAQIYEGNWDKNSGRATSTVVQREENIMHTNTATYNVQIGDQKVEMTNKQLVENFGFNPFLNQEIDGNNRTSHHANSASRDRFIDEAIDFSVDKLDFAIKVAIVAGATYLVLWAGSNMIGMRRVQ